MPTYHLIINGRVQGVFYRATAKKVADELNLTGWVKNTADNSVEAMITGPQDQLQKFITWSKRGPENADVTDVIATKQNETIFNNFSILR